jgi:DNA-binding transcriptional ArsR family regulator
MKAQSYEEWVSIQKSEFRSTRVRLLEEITARSKAAFEAKDKTLLPGVGDLECVVETTSRTVRNEVGEMLRLGLIIPVQDGRHRRYAIGPQRIKT